MTADFKLDTDVLVLGSGPAGFAAAIAVSTGKKLCEIDAADIRKKVGI